MLKSELHNREPSLSPRPCPVVQLLLLPTFNIQALIRDLSIPFGLIFYFEDPLASTVGAEVPEQV